MRERVDQLVGAVARHVGDDVPRRLRPHPAARGRPPRATARTSRSTTRPTRCASSGRASRSSAAIRSASRRAASTRASPPRRTASSRPTQFRENIGNFFEQVVADVFELYERRLHASNAMDFDDLLVRTRRAARELRRRARALAGSVQPPARRRVPGHEPRAVPHRAPALGRAPQRLRRRRRRPGRSTPGAAPTSATSSTSSATSRTRASSGSSRTTARRSASSTPPTPSSSTTRAASRSGSGATSATASRCA